MRTATVTPTENFDHDALNQTGMPHVEDNVTRKAERGGKRPTKEMIVAEAEAQIQADEELGEGWNHLTVPDGTKSRVIRSIRSSFTPWKHEEIRYFDEDYNFGVALGRAMDCVQNAFHVERTGGEDYSRMPDFDRGKRMIVTVEIV